MRFYIAWADADEAFGEAHEVEDIPVFAFTLSQVEGDFTVLDVIVPNPGGGLLSSGRKQWAWFAVDPDVTDVDVAVPLFFGRLVAVPQQIDGETVRLSFRARPNDFVAQKAALAAAMRVAPYYDPIWVTADRREDPDAVLEFYPAVWHVNRVTHEVTASDITSGAGEDGTIDFAGNIFYDSLQITLGSPPLKAVQVEGQVTWDQAAVGQIDLSEQIKAAFQAVGSGDGWLIRSLTGGGLMEDWPEEGDRIGSGWSVGTSTIERSDGKTVEQDYVTVIVDNAQAKVPVWTMLPTFYAAYDANRQRSEKVTFTLRADCQAMAGDPDEDDIQYLSLASPDAGQPIDGGALPIGDVRRRAYFPTDRGRQSVTALIARARAMLLSSARAVQVSFDVPFLDALTLSCAMDARVADARLPGGEATGKVIAYTLALDGDMREPRASVTIGCTIGAGNTVSADDGDPDYAEDDYAEDGWQTATGAHIMPAFGGITYLDFAGIPPQDDGVVFFNLKPADVIVSLNVYNGESAQQNVLEQLHADLPSAIDALNEIYTEIDLELVPLDGGPFETIYTLLVSRLMVPRTIDLEAP